MAETHKLHRTKREFGIHFLILIKTHNFMKNRTIKRKRGTESSFGFHSFEFFLFRCQ